MTEVRSEARKEKISPEFAARLDHFGPRQKVRAVIVVQTGGRAGKTTGQRRSRVKRQAAIEALRRSAELALPDIDSILERFGGKRLVEDPSALGTLPVETTVDGIKALAASDHVKAVLEDQPVSIVA